MKKKNIKLACLFTILIILLTVGCGENVGEVNNNVDKENEGIVSISCDISYEGELVLKGLEEDYSVSFNDIYKMESVTKEVTHVSSSGEESVDTVTGVLLDTVLATFGESQKNYTNIRLTAGDGYAITVPSEIINEKDIILAYAFNGEPLDEKEQPLRSAIEDARSMYYVSNLIEIEFSKEEIKEAETSDKQIIIFDNAVGLMHCEEFVYYDSSDIAINVKDLFDAYSVEGEEVAFIASDGFEKVETMDVIYEGFIKYTGEDAPLFTGLDLPKGMNVKYIMKMAVGDTSFITVNSAVSALENITIGDATGVSLSEIVKMGGLEADYYLLTATDGYSVEVAKESLDSAIVYVDQEGSVAARFDSDNPQKSTVKYLLKITAGEGQNVKTFEGSSTETSDAATIGWAITFEGLSDGSFDITNEKAEMKLELVSLNTEKTKDDVKIPESWEGYKILDILDFLHVDDFNSITVVSTDGYEVELTNDQVDAETIIAITKDGKKLSGNQPVQLVQNTQFATTWVKEVAKVIVK